MSLYQTRDNRFCPKKGSDPLEGIKDPGKTSARRGSDPFFGQSRRGLTLVELLVVIGIIVVLMAIAVPLMKMNQESRPIREASRAVNAYVAAAQSRAAEKGRPVGVWIDRAENNSGSSFRLFMADVAPPYIGDTSEARARIGPLESGGYRVIFPPVPNLSGPPSPVPRSTALPTLVQVGDVIRFGFRGPYYAIRRIVDPDPDAPVIEISLGGNTQPPTRGSWSPAPPPDPQAMRVFGPMVTYQILRAPRKSRFSSIELPNAAAIDLRVSGAGAALGPVLFEPSPNDTSPVVIMFSPSGRVDHLRVQGQILVPQETIHLMIGNNELVNDLADPAASLGGEQNLEAEKALTNLWVSIGTETGSVTTAELNATGALPPSYSRADFVQRVINSRQIANEKHQMGGG